MSGDDGGVDDREDDQLPPHHRLNSHDASGVVSYPDHRASLLIFPTPNAYDLFPFGSPHHRPHVLSAVSLSASPQLRSPASPCHLLSHLLSSADVPELREPL